MNNLNDIVPGAGGLSSVLIRVLTRVQTFADREGLACYLVGGVLRDQLLGRFPAYLNVDLAIPRGTLTAAPRLAAYLHGAFVPLDEEAGSARVVVSESGHRVELDLNDFRGSTLEADLARRDFTINAIAIALSDWLNAPHALRHVIDPLGGRQALARRALIPCFPGTFMDDPVRILRAFRFVAQLDATLDGSALPLITAALARLSAVSGERIRDELIAIFETDRAHIALQGLNTLGVLDVVFPELSAGRGMKQGGVHHLDVLGHQLETVAQADRIFLDFAEFSTPLRAPLAAYGAEQLVERRSRKSLIKLAGLLHDAGKPAKRTVEADGEIWFIGHEHVGAALAEGIVERLRLANREAEMICQLIRHHLRPGFLSREPQLTRRAVYRFFKDLGDHGPGCLLAWWADRMAARGPQSRLDQLDQQRSRLEELLSAYFFKAEEVVRPPRLVDGYRLMESLKLKPGPLIGALLAAIEEAQAEGRVRSTEEALALARSHLEGRPPK